MDMKVNGPTDPRLNGAGFVSGARAAEAARRAAQTTSARPAADEATLSERARLLQKARAALEQAPETRQDKVDALRNAITEGTYQIDVRALADRLMRWIK